MHYTHTPPCYHSQEPGHKRQVEQWRGSVTRTQHSFSNAMLSWSWMMGDSRIYCQFNVEIWVNLNGFKRGLDQFVEKPLMSWNIWWLHIPSTGGNFVFNTRDLSKHKKRLFLQLFFYSCRLNQHCFSSKKGFENVWWMGVGSSLWSDIQHSPPAQHHLTSYEAQWEFWILDILKNAGILQRCLKYRLTATPEPSRLTPENDKK